MPPDFTIFLDENHCENKKLLAVLRDACVRVERHLQHFPPGTPDTEWLRFVGERAWSIITTDKAIRKRTLERQAVQTHKVLLFCFTSNRMSGEQMANAMITAMVRIRKISERQPAPFIATISPAGVVEVYETFGVAKADLR